MLEASGWHVTVRARLLKGFNSGKLQLVAAYLERLIIPELTISFSGV